LQPVTDFSYLRLMLIPLADVIHLSHAGKYGTSPTRQ
jgi:hypothetical protein